MKDIYYVIRWSRGKRGKEKILGEYETVEEAKKHYPTRKEMARMMYEDVEKWEYEDVDHVMLLDDDDQFSIEMMGEGVSDYLGPRCCGQPLERVYDLDYMKWREVRKTIRVADNEWENLFLEVLAKIDKAITKQEGLYKWSEDEYEQGYTHGIKNAYNILTTCMSNMRYAMIMKKEKKDKEKKDSQVQDKECDE